MARPQEQVEVKLNVSFESRAGALQVVTGRPSSLIGIPYDRPIVGYGGKTINTLRLWSAAASNYFDFQEFSTGDFASALAETLAAESLTRVLYPDDSTSKGQRLRFVQEYFLVACSLADLVRRFRKTNADWSSLADKVAIQLNDTHPAMAVPELLRILLDDDALAEFAGQFLSSSHVREARCEYLRYKPKQNCLARFRVFSADGRASDFYACEKPRFQP